MTKFNPARIFDALEQNLKVFEAILSNKTQEEYTWKQDSGKWSLLIIVCHLLDEEILDFRTRLQTTLESPGKVPPPIDPEKWVLDRKYAEQNYEDKLSEFLAERGRSIDWLRSLEDPKWNNSYTHEKFGELTTEFFLTNWLAHDLLHIKQITRLNYDYISQLSSQPYAYAGLWT